MSNKHFPTNRIFINLLYSFSFYNGDKNEITFELGEKVKEIYVFSNGNKNVVIYELGKKVKEINTNGPGDHQDQKCIRKMH